MKRIVLIGAGGFGREVAYLIEWLNRIEPSSYEMLGFLDDGEQFHEGMTINGYPWLGRHDWILAHRDDVVCTCTIGAPHIKKMIQEELMAQGVRFETIIDRSSFVGPFTELGPGCVIYGGTNVSVNCRIGAGVLLNSHVDIGHDAVIGDYTSIMPGTSISGGCKIGSCVNFGGHAFVVPGRKIGDGATVAAGSIVFTNVKAGTTVLGNPARRMREIE